MVKCGTVFCATLCFPFPHPSNSSGAVLTGKVDLILAHFTIRLDPSAFFFLSVQQQVLILNYYACAYVDAALICVDTSASCSFWPLALWQHAASCFLP